MPYHPMDEAEVREFLRSPVRTATVGTTRKDGRPHVAPVWYDVDDDGTIVFNTGADTLKAAPSGGRAGSPSVCRTTSRPTRSCASRATPPGPTTCPRCARGPPASAGATWAPTAPRSTGAAPGGPASGPSGAPPPP